MNYVLNHENQLKSNRPKGISTKIYIFHKRIGEKNKALVTNESHNFI